MELYQIYEITKIRLANGGISQHHDMKPIYFKYGINAERFAEKMGWHYKLVELDIRDECNYDRLAFKCQRGM